MVWNFQILVFWGAAIVVFLARIINFHNDDLQGFWVEVSSQVENGTCHTDTCHTCLSGLESTDFLCILGLITATGIGLVPFRVIGTYSKSSLQPLVVSFT